jgi:hypothetical protein
MITFHREGGGIPVSTNRRKKAEAGQLACQRCFVLPRTIITIPVLTNGMKQLFYLRVGVKLGLRPVRGHFGVLVGEASRWPGFLWGHCFLPAIDRTPQLRVLGGVGSTDHRVLNLLVIGAKQHVGGGSSAEGGLDRSANADYHPNGENLVIQTRDAPAIR